MGEEEISIFLSEPGVLKILFCQIRHSWSFITISDNNNPMNRFYWRYFCPSGSRILQEEVPLMTHQCFPYFIGDSQLPQCNSGFVSLLSLICHWDKWTTFFWQHKKYHKLGWNSTIRGIGLISIAPEYLSVSHFRICFWCSKSNSTERLKKIECNKMGLVMSKQYYILFNKWSIQLVHSTL